MADYLQPVAIREPQVEEHRGGVPGCYLRHGLAGGGGLVELIAFGGECRPKKAADLLVILDHQNQGFRHFDLSKCGLAPAFSSGKRIRKIAPPPGRLNASMVPRWAITIALQMARPRPAPRMPSDLPR